jgi:hypothetical protein
MIDMAKSQSAMEYLMTYGWSILIIAVILGMLYSLNVFNTGNIAPKAQPGSCKVFRPNGPGTSLNLNLAGICIGQLPQYTALLNGGYINSGNSAMLTPANAITLAIWIKPANTSIGEQYAIGNAPGGVGYNYDIGIRYNLLVAGAFCSNIYCLSVPIAGTIMNNTWYFVAFTAINGGSTAMFVNGKTVASGSTGTAVFPGGYLMLGDLRPGRNALFYGSLANAQVYNSSLDASQIQALYSEGIGGAPIALQNLVGWWPLNGDAKDYSGNNNNGAPPNMAYTSRYS